MGILESTELIQFIGALVFLVGILVGSYWFVYAPIRRENQEHLEKEEEKEKDSETTSR